MLKPLTVWVTANWKILKEMGIPDHLTCLPRNRYASQEATVRTGHETIDWFQIGKGVCQGCILSVQFSSVVQSCLTLCNPMNCSTQASLSIINSWSSLKLMSIESVMPSSHLILCHPLLLLPLIAPSISLFQ